MFNLLVRTIGCCFVNHYECDSEEPCRPMFTPDCLLPCFFPTLPHHMQVEINQGSPGIPLDALNNAKVYIERRKEIVSEKNFLDLKISICDQLIYLSTIREIDLREVADVEGTGKKWPITQTEWRIFRASKRANLVTEACLNCGFCTLAPLALAPLVVPCIIGHVACVYCTACGAASAAGAVGLVTTGTNPHTASNMANQKQDARHALQERFLAYSQYLLHNVYSKYEELALELVTSMDLEVMRQLLQEADLNHSESLDIIKPLEATKKIIMGELTLEDMTALDTTTGLFETAYRVLSDKQKQKLVIDRNQAML